MTDLFDIAGKTALVTGGSQGIGLMIARGLVEAGVSVFIASRRGCEDTAAELSAVHGQNSCVGLPADLSSEAECRRLAAEVAARTDRLHILVNNAGAVFGAKLVDHDDQSWDRVLNLNVKAVFHLTKFLLPSLTAAATIDDPSRIVNIGSIDGERVPPLETYSYSSSKAAVHHLTRHLAKQLAPEVTVNAVAPGPFESRMMRATLDTLGDDIVAGTPLKRIGRPEDMVGVVLYLTSRAGSYLTGAVIPVDGGLAALSGTWS